MSQQLHDKIVDLTEEIQQTLNDIAVETDVFEESLLSYEHGGRKGPHWGHVGWLQKVLADLKGTLAFLEGTED